MLLLAVKSNFPLTWYGPIALCVAVWFLGGFVYSYMRGFIYAGDKPRGSWKKITREEDPKKFRLWLGVLAMFCILFTGLAVWGFISHPIS